MGLFTVIKGMFNDAEEAVSNTEFAQETELRQSMRDMDEAMKTARTQKTKILAQKNSSEATVEKIQTEIDRLNQAGKKLFGQSKEQEGVEKDRTLAQLDKLSDQISTKETELASSQQLLKVQEQNYAKIKADVAKMERQVKQAKNNKVMLDGKKAVHNARKNTVSVQGVDSKMSRAMEIMEKSEQRLSDQTFELEAAEEIYAEEHVDVDAILAESNSKSAADRWG